MYWNKFTNFIHANKDEVEDRKRLSHKFKGDKVEESMNYRGALPGTTIRKGFIVLS